MATLPTNYQDDVLASSMDGKRHYTMSTDTHGTTFTDISEYTQQGSAFGAAQINETNTQVNTNTGQIASLGTQISNLNTNKLNTNGDGQNVTVTYTSNDVSSDASATSWTVISKFTSGETLKSLFGKVSTLCKNVRYLYNNKRSKSESFNSTSDTVSFTTADVVNDAAATSWTANVAQLTSGLTHANLLNRISAMMKNTRFLYNQLFNPTVYSKNDIVASASEYVNWSSSDAIALKFGKLVQLDMWVRLYSAVSTHSELIVITAFKNPLIPRNDFTPVGNCYALTYTSNTFYGGDVSCSIVYSQLYIVSNDTQPDTVRLSIMYLTA